MKEEVKSGGELALLGPQLAVLTTCIDGNGTPNILTQTWVTPVCFEPGVLVLSTFKGNYSHELIKKSGEFVINIPSAKLLEKVWFCGSNSGREVNKFKETGLTAEKSLLVAPPSIKECIASIECKVSQSVDIGEHTLFFGEIVKARVDSSVFEKNYLLDKVQLVYVSGEHCYALNPDSL